MTPDKQQEIAQSIAALVSHSSNTCFFVKLMDSHKHDTIETRTLFETWLTGEVIRILQEEA